MEQPPQLGGISLPIHHLMVTHPHFLRGAEIFLLTKLLLFSSAPASSLFPLLRCRPALPFHLRSLQWAGAAAWGSDRGLRGSTSSLCLQNTLRSQNRPLNPGLVMLRQLYKQHREFTYRCCRAFDKFIKQLGQFNTLLLQFFVLLHQVLNISSYVQKNNFPRTVLILKFK